MKLSLDDQKLVIGQAVASCLNQLREADTVGVAFVVVSADPATRECEVIGGMSVQPGFPPKVMTELVCLYYEAVRAKGATISDPIRCEPGGGS